MRYLHEHDPPLLHRDLKSPNMLVSEADVLKVTLFTRLTQQIADFGTARIFELQSDEGASRQLVAEGHSKHAISTLSNVGTSVMLLLFTT